MNLQNLNKSEQLGLRKLQITGEFDCPIWARDIDVLSSREFSLMVKDVESDEILHQEYFTETLSLCDTIEFSSDHFYISEDIEMIKITTRLVYCQDLDDLEEEFAESIYSERVSRILRVPADSAQSQLTGDFKVSHTLV